MNACVGGSDRKLIEARFLRALSSGERQRLESHLLSCSGCSEKYRRLQLAERVSSVGVDRALEEPSAFEIERVAGDLGLFDPPKPERRWLPFAGLVAAVACALLLIVLRPQNNTEVFTPRGDGKVVSVAAYVISSDGTMRAHRADAPVQRSDHLKLRISRPSTGVAWPQLWLHIGGERALALQTPEDDQLAASIPGAIPLSELKPGRVVFEVVGADNNVLERIELEVQ